VSASNYESLYRDWYARIEHAHGRLGHTLGFNPPIVSSVRAFEATPRLLVLGLNPAGNVDYPTHRGLFRYENENAYVGVDWKGAGAGASKLQRQVQAVFENLRSRLRPDCPAEAFAVTEVVTANYIPFRSPDEEQLRNPKDSKAFALELWRDIFAVWRPQVVVCFGLTPFRAMEKLLGSTPRPSEWNVQIHFKAMMRLHKLPSGTRLLGLPHLSKTPVFSAVQHEAALSEAFDDLCAGVRR
jgi:hypothetical protein